MGEQFRRGIFVLIATAGVLAVLSLSGCTTFNRVLSQTIGGSSSGSSGSGSSQTAAQPGSASGSQQPATTSGAGSAGAAPSAAMQAQFYAVYSMAAPFGGYRFGETGYQPGQGTVWQFTDEGGGNESSTVEHALLRINADGTQWWRVELTSSDETLLYEFLVGSDKLVQKVRYKDPDSGKVIEFVPDRSQGGPAAMPPAAGGFMEPGAMSGAQGKITKDRQTITVKAGTFDTEHVVFTDDQGSFRSESWSSDGVPGVLVKLEMTNLHSGKQARAELVKIESGVTTELQSY